MSNRLFLHKRYVATVLLSCLVALSGCGKEDEQAGAQGGPPPTPVSTVKVTETPTTIFTTLPGRVSAVRDAQVRARVNGIVQKIEFEQGREVKKGQVLFRIDPATYKAQYAQAEAALNQAKATAGSARQLANRYATLVKSNAVSRQEYDDARAQANQADATIASAQAALESARINLSYTDVESPIDGIIGRALVTEGALVSGTEATELANVQQLDPVYVDFTQSTSELYRLRKAMAEGQLTQVDENTARVQLELEDGTQYAEDGKLLFTGVSVEPSTGQVTLRATFPNSDKLLLPGMYVTVKLEQGKDEKALLIPTQAIQRSTDGLSNVMLVRDGKVATVTIQTGGEVKTDTIVTQGVKAGDEVIVEGFQKIRPGAPVKPQPWKKDKAAGNDGQQPESGAQEEPKEGGDNAPTQESKPEQQGDKPAQ
ncbi:efflux transporter periplasmic adaptor subunit [Advenella sp. S44]|uniref:efflux RND transporter periplasmic adaptor subunit n=1 Tax=Advenella sp. S44 TaxID=1982755 RepID=UPI000CB5C5D4|nr:efflux RND transporter periplasmic adaptor subunit [Advenella sp. S44]PJX23742.1 efflux transporter periplasmic adaptor subunit [Advenella sp. S44]